MIRIAPTHLTIMGTLWSSPQQMATGAQLHAAVAATGSPQSANNVNTALWRLRDQGWVRALRGPNANSPVIWVAERRKQEIFESEFRQVLEAFACLGAGQVDPEALALIEAELARLPRSR
jgi:predicted transcriptional regulator